QIFAQTYGGSFRYAGANLTNGTITAVRVFDDQDETFAAGSYSARAIANFSGGNQVSFGTVQNGQYQQLLGAVGRGTAVAQAAKASATFSGPVQFAQGVGGSYSSTSDAANADQADHAITYKLTGLDFGGDVYVVFFENHMRWRSDWDYNDLVV